MIAAHRHERAFGLPKTNVGRRGDHAESDFQPDVDQTTEPARVLETARFDDFTIEYRPIRRTEKLIIEWTVPWTQEPEEDTSPFWLYQRRIING